MGLFTNPVTFTVNTIARIFNYRAQLPDSKSVVGEWIEPSAAASAASKMTIKHDPTSATLARSLFKVSCMKPIADGVTLKPMTVNISFFRHPEHTAVQSDDILELATTAAGTESFRTNFAQGQI